MQGNKALSSEVSPGAVGDWSIHAEGITPSHVLWPIDTCLLCLSGFREA